MMAQSQSDEEEGAGAGASSSPSPACAAALVLGLTRARVDLGAPALERRLAEALSLPASRLTVVVDEDCGHVYCGGGDDDDGDGGSVAIVVYPPDDGGDGTGGDTNSSEAACSSLSAWEIADEVNALIRSGEATSFTCGRDATCAPAEDEESVSVDDEEALRLWREMSEEDRTGHLDAVPNPDGVLVQPTNDDDDDDGYYRCVDDDRRDSLSASAAASPTELQLRRDPTLLEHDNVRRVHASRLLDVDASCWDEPFVITGAIMRIDASLLLDRRRLVEKYGDVEVRTGNRETLIDNGITNSKPMALADALMSAPANVRGARRECGRIVFSPVADLPVEFADELKSLTECMPGYYPRRRRRRGGGGDSSGGGGGGGGDADADPAEDEKFELSKMGKFTLTLASEGFGIGMHKHNVAMFALFAGRKKWYMADGNDDAAGPLGGGRDTHPGFYRELSSHKCVQRPGEVLHVPGGWYHEIFNLDEYTAGIQGLP